jgi:hypothetical protein
MSTTDYAFPYVATALTCFALFFVAAYVGAFYFDALDFPRALTFDASDWPSNAGTVEPNPSYALGVHYFGDFLASWLQTAAPSPYATQSVVWSSNYLPFAHLLFQPFTWLPYHVAVTAFSLLGAAAIIAPMTSSAGRRPWAQRIALIVGGVVLTAPFLSMLDRGNVQSLVSAAVIIAVLCLVHSHNMWAAVLIGLAAAVKGYPLVLLIVLARRKAWREVLAGFATFLIANTVALTTFSGGLVDNLHHLWIATGPFRSNSHATDLNNLTFNNSAFALLHLLGDSAVPWIAQPSGWASSHFGLVVLLLLAITVGLALIPATTLLEQVLVLITFMTLAPVIVGDYALTLYFAPIALIYRRRPGAWPLISLYAMILGLLMAPKGLSIAEMSLRLTPILSPLLQVSLISLVAVAVLRRQRGTGARERLPSPEST